MNSIKGKDFIDLRDFTGDDLNALAAAALQYKQNGNAPTRILEGKTVGMLFTVPSTRTRSSFLIAARRLGGHAELLNPEDLQMKNHESLQDTAAVLGRMFDVLVVRTYDMTNYGLGRRSLETIAHWSPVPVINALDDQDHPCQVLADLITLQEKFGPDYRSKQVVFSWGYSKRQKSPGLSHSWLTAASLLGMNLRVAYPVGFDLDAQYVDFALTQARQSGATIEFCHDLREAAEDADAIYVKNWKSLSLPTEEDARRREEVREEWCLNDSHFDQANPGAVYMDCMPFIRGEQVTASVADGPRSIIYEQAENRIYSAQAVLAALL